MGELELKEDLAVQISTRSGSRPIQWQFPTTPSVNPIRLSTTAQRTRKAYIPVPDITLTVGLCNDPQPSSAIGRVTESNWQGRRHYDIANVRGLYYEEDRSLAIWEVDAWGRLDEFAHGRLWQLFETWLLNRFPGATRIFTDDATPHENVQRNREFLTGLGYEHVTGIHRIFAKEVAR